MRNIWAFYLGWCIAASNINFGIDIVYWWDASKETQMIVFWVMAPLCAIGAFAFNFLKFKKYGALSCFCLWFSVFWAFAGAAIQSHKCINGECWSKKKNIMIIYFFSCFKTSNFYNKLFFYKIKFGHFKWKFIFFKQRELSLFSDHISVWSKINRKYLKR